MTVTLLFFSFFLCGGLESNSPFFFERRDSDSVKSTISGRGMEWSRSQVGPCHHSFSSARCEVPRDGRSAGLSFDGTYLYSAPQLWMMATRRAMKAGRLFLLLIQPRTHVESIQRHVSCKVRESCAWRYDATSAPRAAASNSIRGMVSLGDGLIGASLDLLKMRLEEVVSPTDSRYAATPYADNEASQNTWSVWRLAPEFEQYLGILFFDASSNSGASLSHSDITFWGSGSSHPQLSRHTCWRRSFARVTNGECRPSGSKNIAMACSNSLLERTSLADALVSVTFRVSSRVSQSMPRIFCVSALARSWTGMEDMSSSELEHHSRRFIDASVNTDFIEV